MFKKKFIGDPALSFNFLTLAHCRPFGNFPYSVDISMVFVPSSHMHPFNVPERPNFLDPKCQSYETNYTQMSFPFSEISSFFPALQVTKLFKKRHKKLSLQITLLKLHSKLLKQMFVHVLYLTHRHFSTNNIEYVFNLSE